VQKGAKLDNQTGLRPCPAWELRASTCGRKILPHADKHMFVYVLEVELSETALRCINLMF
jgi:hypothetical protein